MLALALDYHQYAARHC